MIGWFIFNLNKLEHISYFQMFSQRDLFTACCSSSIRMTISFLRRICTWTCLIKIFKSDIALGKSDSTENKNRVDQAQNIYEQMKKLPYKQMKKKIHQARPSFQLPSSPAYTRKNRGPADM